MGVGCSTTVNSKSSPIHRRYEADAPTRELGEEADTQ
jgi:hypothetical protein